MSISLPETALPAPKVHRTPWRDNIEAIVVAIVMALVLKYFAVEAYRIPTGSMQPTLMGNAQTGIFDRILVDKFAYVARDPRRFEVAVFRYPLDRSKNFVKRIVGVGPEELMIHNGDLWRRDSADDDWVVLRRPRLVQRETWLALAKQEPDRALFHGSEDRDWSAGRDATLHGPFRMRFGESRTSVMDAYSDGYPDWLYDDIPRNRNGSGQHAVGDLRIDGEVTADAACERVQVVLREGALRYTLALPGPAAPEGTAPRITVEDLGPGTFGGRVVAEAEGEPLRLEAGRAYAFGAQNLDDLLELELDGEVLLGQEIASLGDQGSSLEVEVLGDGCTVELADLMVYRDIHYTDDRVIKSRFEIPAGHYLMLGDNTLDSSDGRMWQRHRLEVRDGDGGTHVVEGNHRTGGMGQTDFDFDMNPVISTAGLEPMTWFRDEWGELHAYGPGEVAPADPMTVPAPYVPRDMMLGRAVAVFWPLKPLDWNFRLKLVR